MFEDNLCKEWDSKYEKHSHEGKSLVRHIEEVKHTLKQFLAFYDDFPEIYHEVAYYLAEYHDYGKLCKNWDISRSEKPPHSPMSVEWLMNNAKLFESDKEWTFILWYFILKHHSRLSDISGMRKYKPLVDEVKRKAKEIDIKNRVDLVDVFGLFKIADILSAANEFFKPKSPEVNEKIVKAIIGDCVDDRIWKQQLALEKLDNIGILRAPTGWGKTTASLLFLLNKPAKKIFFLLPTITAINKFHAKLSSGLASDVAKYFYFYDAEVSEDEDKLNELFFVENFMSPFVITTIDQFLLSFLQYGKYHTKRIMFRGAGLIFDEVHLLNPLMLSLTKHFLKKYAALYKLKALFMSATMPDALSQFLMEGLDVPKQSFLDYANEYRQRRRIMLTYNSDSLEKSIDLIVDYVKKGRKVLTLLNTVDKSVEIAKLLRQYLSPNEVILIHSRLMYRDRKNKEEEIDKKSETPHVLVSTQISEVSLDISYDVLFTEVSPLPSMVQRFGRVNRRGSWTNEVNTQIYEPTISNESRYPYELNDIDLSRKIVKEVEGEKLRNEGQLLDLLNGEYSYEYLQQEIDNAMKKVDLEAFDEIFGFFSLDAGGDKLMNVLNYRDSFSILVIPDPICVCEDTLKKHICSLISQPLEEMDFAQKRALIAAIKNVSLPIPIWWLDQGRYSEGAPFPVVSFKNKKYDNYYGLIEGDV